ncbi:ABC transporter permease [Roseibium sp.]
MPFRRAQGCPVPGSHVTSPGKAAAGIVFVTFPARRAARMNPIDALRYE